MANPGAAKASQDKSGGQVGQPVQERAHSPGLTGPHADILTLQRAAGNRAVGQALRASSVGGVPPIARSVFRSNGRPLDATTRSFMESRFQHDFSDVRIHAGPAAALGTTLLGARAATVGTDIAFSAGRYAPNTPTGRRLLAHELTHVVQQSASGAPVPSTASEAEAKSAGEYVSAGQDVTVTGVTNAGTLQLDPEEQAGYTCTIPKENGRLAVVFVRNGKVVKGYAEIKPPPGMSLGEAADLVTLETEDREGEPVPDVRVVLPPGWGRQATNPTAPVEVLDKREHTKRQREAKREAEMDALRDLYGQYLNDFDFQYETYGGIAVPPIHAAIASEESLLKLGEDPHFIKWINRRREQRHYERIRRENLGYQGMMGGPEFGLSPEEARKIYWSGTMRPELGVPIYDEETGVHVGYVKYATAEKELGGAVGTVTKEYYDVKGRLQSKESTTVLTPAAEVFQDLARNTPGLGYTINVAEIGMGESLDLRDRGRKLSNAEVVDRAFSALPGGDTARGAAEAISGVSLSSGEDLERAWEGENLRLLTGKQRIAKGVLAGIELVGRAKMKFRPKVRPKFRPKFPKKPGRRWRDRFGSRGRTISPDDITVDLPPKLKATPSPKTLTPSLSTPGKPPTKAARGPTAGETRRQPSRKSLRRRPPGKWSPTRLSKKQRGTRTQRPARVGGGEPESPPPVPTPGKKLDTPGGPAAGERLDAPTKTLPGTPATPKRKRPSRKKFRRRPPRKWSPTRLSKKQRRTPRPSTNRPPRDVSTKPMPRRDTPTGQLGPEQPPVRYVYAEGKMRRVKEAHEVVNQSGRGPAKHRPIRSSKDKPQPSSKQPDRDVGAEVRADVEETQGLITDVRRTKKGTHRQIPEEDVARERLEQPKQSREAKKKAKRKESHDLGVEGGEIQARKEGIEVIEDFEPPQKFKGDFGEGIDGIGKRGNKWIILEYKGGGSSLQGDQMANSWLGRKIAQLYISGERALAAQLLLAVKQRRLQGVVYHTRGLKHGVPDPRRLRGKDLRGHLPEEKISKSGLIEYAPTKVRKAFRDELRRLRKKYKIKKPKKSQAKQAP